MRRVVPILLVLFFALTAGPFAYRVWAPLQSPEHFVGGDLRPYVAPPELAGGGKVLYLRKSLPLTRNPRHAWLQLVGHDTIAVYVNGEHLGRSHGTHPHGANAVLVDIAARLKRGPNSIAVVVGQRTIGRPPAVAIDGAVIVSEQQPLSLTDGWKCASHFQHTADFWYETSFDDSGWLDAELADARPLRGQVGVPPESIKRPPSSNWIAPREVVAGKGAIRREFQVEGRPQHAWMRVMTTAPYTLAVNGNIMRTDHDQLAKPPPYGAKIALFDISPMVRKGRNVVALMLTSPGEAPQINADMEVIDKQGRATFVETDERWEGLGGAPLDWHRLSTPHLVWEPCRSESGPLDGVEMRQERQFASKGFKTDWFSGATFGTIVAVATAGLLAWAACWLVGSFTRWLAPTTPPLLAFAGLAVPAVACLAGMLLPYDMTIGQSDVYQPKWLLAAMGVLLAYWATMILGAVLLSEPAEELPGRRQVPRWIPALALLTILAAGLALRTRNILAEPMHHDEVGAYFFTMSVWEQGFPGGQVHPELPFGYCATSELVYFFNAPFALVFDDPRLVIRVPAMLWSVYTILLLYFVSRSIFGLPTALVAATLYAVSPYLAGMANFGRYFSQLQFFGLLTCYAYWRTIEGRGPINRRWLWVTAVSFLAMYYSWEGAGFLALGLICAALVHRRGRLRTIFLCPSIYASLALVAAGFLAQNAHRMFQQTQRLWYGSGISDMSIMPMWRYPRFDLIYYLRESTWIADTVVPMFCLLAAMILALRHPRREAMRVFLTIAVSTALAMVLLLPLRATRYMYHVTPLLIMMNAVVITTLARGVARLGRGVSAPEWSRPLAAVPAGILIVAFTIVTSGYWGQLWELSAYRIAAYRPGVLKFPNWEDPLRFVRKNMREGDALIALHPHIVDMTMLLAEDNPVPEGWRSDYWLQSVMLLQATIGDTEDVPRDRRAGTRMITGRQELERVFQDHERVWYVTMRYVHAKINHADVSELMRQHMDIVYEDATTLVMLRNPHHNRTAEARLADERASELARTWIVK